jgi:hypothetical protein
MASFSGIVEPLDFTSPREGHSMSVFTSTDIDRLEKARSLAELMTSRQIMDCSQREVRGEITHAEAIEIAVQCGVINAAVSYALVQAREAVERDDTEGERLFMEGDRAGREGP